MQWSLWGIRLEGWLTIAAIIVGPIFALLAQRWLDRLREEEHRKLNVFKELMATRATTLSPRHVEALNAIEIEFSKDRLLLPRSRRRNRKVIEAWRLYFDHLCTTLPDGADHAAHALWAYRRNELMFDLLMALSEALGFSYDRLTISKGAYYPKALGELEAEQAKFRKFFTEVMEGRRVMWTGVITDPQKPLHFRLDQAGAAPNTTASETKSAGIVRE